MKMRMKIPSILLCLFFLPSGSFAGQPGGNEAMNRLSVSAEQELAKSIQDLNRLREQIATEKLPLAQELTTLEEKLAQLRRDYEKVTRLVDAGTLEITTIRAEMKARQDELTYIAGLLDEYARSFESKANVSELQYLGKDIDAAKQATENTALSLPEKFTRQVAFVDVSAKRLFNAIQGLRFPGVAVDLQGNIADGQFAIIGPVALFSSKNGSMAGLALSQSGSTRPLIRPLEGDLQAGITPLVDHGEGTLPLDPSRGGALKALVQKTSLIHIFKKGGPIMWPLLLAAALALVTVLERVLFLLNERRKYSPRAREAFLAAVGQGDMESALRISASSKFYVVRTLGYALAHRDTSLANALLYAQEKELKRFRRGIPILDTVITLAPLLGLLGTVTGMMRSFSLIGGELSAPGAITGGIAEALIATAFGLGIAITSLIPFNILNTRMEEARHEIESAAKELELLVHPGGSPEVAPADLMPDSHDGGNGQEREIRRKRDALQRQMTELKSKIDAQVQEMEHLADQERGLRGPLVRDLPVED
jgi:biopolymer transport protein ExbB